MLLITNSIIASCWNSTVFFSVLSGDSVRNEQANADCCMASGVLPLIELEMYCLALLHLTWDDQADTSVLQGRR